jgi:hypothetical protein
VVADSSSKAGNGKPEAAEISNILILPLDGVERDSFDEPDFSGVLSDARRLIGGRAYAAACQLLDGELRQATSTGREAGPKTAELLFELGVCRYELQDWDAAEQRFREGLAIVRKIGRDAEEGAFLHELSMVAAARSDAVGAINLAREALVSKLRRLTRAEQNSRVQKRSPARRAARRGRPPRGPARGGGPVAVGRKAAGFPARQFRGAQRPQVVDEDTDRARR